MASHLIPAKDAEGQDDEAIKAMLAESFFNHLLKVESTRSLSASSGRAGP